MALLHQAELRPTKLALLAAWLPDRGWYQSGAADLVRVAGYRFDDPAGEVGVETLLVRAGDGPVHQVPLTYRGAPLDGAADWLIGTMEHSVLGRRWVYDACGDPVYAATLATAILSGTGQAEEVIEVDGQLVHRAPSMTLTSAAEPGNADVPAVGAILEVVPGDPTRIVTDPVVLTVIRRLAGRVERSGTALTGTWSGQSTPLPLAYASPR